MSLEPALIVRDPLHGNMVFTAVEKAIIDSRAFQRLRGLKQSSLAHYTYPTALTTRFEHSLGAAHVAGKIIMHLFSTCREGMHLLLADLRSLYDPDFGNLLTPESQEDLIVQGVRLAALFHDLGHLPFSHCFEEEFKSYVLRDELAPTWASGTKDRRAEFKALHGRLAQLTGAKLQLHEYLSYVIASEHPSITRLLTTPDLRLAHRLALDILIPPDEIREKQHPIVQVLGRIIHGEFDADRMDFIRRDAGMSGSGLGTFDIDRLIACLRVDTSHGHLELWPSVRGVSAVEGFFAARLNVYRWQYHHHNVVFHDLALRLVVRDILSDKLGKYRADTLIRELSVQALLNQTAEPASLSGWTVRDDGYLWALLMNVYGDMTRDELGDLASEDALILRCLLEEVLYRQKHHVALWKDRLGFDDFVRELCDEFRKYVLRHSDGGGATEHEIDNRIGDYCTSNDGKMTLEAKLLGAILNFIAKEGELGALQAWLWARGERRILIDYREFVPFRRLPEQRLSSVRLWGRGDATEGTHEMGKVSDVMAGLMGTEFDRVRLFAYQLCEDADADDKAAGRCREQIAVARRALAREVIEWAFAVNSRISDATCETLCVKRNTRREGHAIAVEAGAPHNSEGGARVEGD